MKAQQPSNNNTYLFQVELLVEDSTNNAAIEQLLKALNQLPFPDYRILKGVQLGQLIQERLAESSEQYPIDVTQAAAPSASAASSPILSGFDAIRSYMKSNKLIRLIVNKGLGIKLSIPCRIINMDEDTTIITVYHVDEKQVYTFRLNEIEDFQE